MATGLPPPPINAPSGSFVWLEWYRKLRDFLATNGSVPWAVVDKAGSKLSDIADRKHSYLQNVQGGSAGEQYHLTQGQHTGLTGGSSTTLHTHAHNNLTGLQGGTTNEEYHLTLAQHTKVTGPTYLEVADTTSTITLTTTPQVLKPPTTVYSNNITYDSSTGVFTFPYAGTYSQLIAVNAIASSANQSVYIYAENWNGTSWVVNTNSGKQQSLINNNITQVVLPNPVRRTAGQQVRYMIYSNSNNVQLQTTTLPGTTAIVPTIRIQYSG